MDITLVGTERQVAVANDIRMQSVQRVDAWIAESMAAVRLDAKTMSDDEAQQLIAEAEAGLADWKQRMLERKTSAAWWIEHPKCSGSLLLQMGRP